MRGIHALVVAASLSCAGWSHGATGEDPSSSRTSPDMTVATIGGIPISLAQLDDDAKDRLARIRSEEYTVRRRVLEDLIDRTLLQREATARGTTVEDLIRQEVEARVPPVTEDHKRAAYEGNPTAYEGKSESEALALIGANLRRARLAEARRRFLAELRAKAEVRILMEPPRTAVTVGDAPVLGPSAAPVTVIEFSDFQCPYCARVASTLKRLRERYGDRIRVAFRDFPLAMHKQAAKAAEAAHCSHEQGKFWEMHDRLFANQRALQEADLKRYAGDIGLDLGRFGECLDSGKAASDWQSDMADGSRHGVTGTPTFFVNGRIVKGAQSFQSLVELIDEELAGSGGSLAAQPIADQPGRGELDAPKGRVGSLQRVAEPGKVCMMNDRLIGTDQMPVRVEGRTYYGCCQGCKDRLARDVSTRTATDPVSGRRVDKAGAVMGARPDGSVLYFENEENLEGYASGRPR